jgi:dTDP-4-dehydrorhamnose 3,5-epimerase
MRWDRLKIMVLTCHGEFTPAGILDRFTPDRPLPKARPRGEDRIGGKIDGCQAFELTPGSDARGDLFELLTTREGGTHPIVHVYQVWAEAGSIRAWVYHTAQCDRLCFTAGSFRVVLCDPRPASPTCGQIVSLLVGAGAPTLLTIPPLVIHGVQNVGAERAAFVNLPTNVYYHEKPDKRRLPYDSPLIPFRW